MPDFSGNNRTGAGGPTRGDRTSLFLLREYFPLEPQDIPFVQVRI
jgi:hypothetical protein